MTGSSCSTENVGKWLLICVCICLLIHLVNNHLPRSPMGSYCAGCWRYSIEWNRTSIALMVLPVWKGGQTWSHESYLLYFYQGLKYFLEILEHIPMDVVLTLLGLVEGFLRRWHYVLKKKIAWPEGWKEEDSKRSHWRDKGTERENRANGQELS